MYNFGSVSFEQEVAIMLLGHLGECMHVTNTRTSPYNLHNYPLAIDWDQVSDWSWWGESGRSQKLPASRKCKRVEQGQAHTGEKHTSERLQGREVEGLHLQIHAMVHQPSTQHEDDVDLRRDALLNRVYRIRHIFQNKLSEKKHCNTDNGSACSRWGLHIKHEQNNVTFLNLEVLSP